MCLGMTPELDHRASCTTWRWSAPGPPGLRRRSMPRPKGLSVLVLDQRAIGGQAGASARIENYLGFPTGISGRRWRDARSARRRNSAPRSPSRSQVAYLDCGGPARRPHEPLRLELADGRSMRARTVVVASGARYRQPNIPNLADFEGAGMSYWASPVEAKLCEGEEVALVGGGNSAGQAVVFLAPKVKHLHLVVRGDGLEATMSRYLIDRIEALPNVDAPHRHRGGRRSRATESRRCSAARRSAAATPATCIDLSAAAPVPVHRRRSERAAGSPSASRVDDKGFVITGGTFAPTDAGRARAAAAGNQPSRACSRSATCARARPSASRAAVGEGAAVVAQIHAALAQQV